MYKIEVNEMSLIINKKVILNNINLQLKAGSIYGIIGRNGSGKTVLMKCICGFMRPTSGQILVDGLVIGKDCDFPKNTGIIIETPEFYPYFSGLHNLKNLAALQGTIKKKQIEAVMRMVGLDPSSKLAVKKYSLGMRQRLGLAQAIMENPDLLILDEPMNGLDEEGVREIRNFLLQQKEAGKTIILASHSTEDIKILCDETFMIEHGNLKISL